jgi:protein gp37
VFVNSLADWCHRDVPDEFVVRMFAVMVARPEHTFQLLTKRPARMRALLACEAFADLVEDEAGAFTHGYDGTWPPPNIWLGVSVENQAAADLRIRKLLETPAAVRFLSCEPLLGPVELDRWLRPVPDCPDIDPEDGTCGNNANPHGPECHIGVSCPRTTTWRGIDWVIVGAESGPDARPMHPQWARGLRDQCQAAGVAFFFKQQGEWAPKTEGGTRPGDICMSEDGTIETVEPGYVCLPNESDGEWLRRVGKKAAGRLLDGRIWDEYPTVATARSA